MHRILVALLGLACLSCAWRGVTLVEEVSGERYPRPPRAAEGGGTVVYGRDREVGRQALEQMLAVAPHIQELLGCDAELPEIWLLDQSTIQGRASMYASGEEGNYLLFSASSFDSLEYLVAHELAHWCSASLGVDLPLVVEEGLADMAVITILPQLHETMLEQRASLGRSADWPLERALELDTASWNRLQHLDELELRSIGFLLVLNLGLEDLAELRETARAQGLDRVPAEWFLGEGPGAAYPRLKAQ